ncbi:MAG: DUF302 domain-containing protein [SAR324 cluster bacterium]|nr:DUF302 domain-containing protein [SAR324 cluster bacterium]
MNLSTRVRIFSSLLPALALLAVALAMPAQAHDPRERVRITSPDNFQTTLKKLRQSLKSNKMGLVNTANAQAGAKFLGIDIPGNQVWGVYHPRFAVRMLKASVEAGIEAPIRIYITEAKDGKVTVSYIKPSHVFRPYGNAELNAMAKELDTIFAKITTAVR